jgi:hypothetical protein
MEDHPDSLLVVDALQGHRWMEQKEHGRIQNMAFAQLAHDR